MYLYLLYYLVDTGREGYGLYIISIYNETYNYIITDRIHDISRKVEHRGQLNLHLNIHNYKSLLPMILREIFDG